MECYRVIYREYYEKTREKRLALKQRKYEEDPWVIRVNALKQRCKHGFVSPYQLKRLWEDSGSRCHYCNQQITGVFHFDHAIPVARGGTNDIENLRVACESCNSKKQAMTESEFLKKETGVPF
jgi:5-methylcytosine-specific restriction endonuclease McrA